MHPESPPAAPVRGAAAGGSPPNTLRERRIFCKAIWNKPLASTM